MIDAVHDGFALGHQASQHQTGRGPEIGRHNRRRGQPLHPPGDGGIALQLEIGAHALQFMHVHKAILEHRLGDRPGAFRDTVHGRKLGLHIGREARKGRGVDVDRLGFLAVHIERYGVGLGSNAGAGLAELGQHRFQQIGAGIFQAYPPARDRRGDQIGAGLNAIRQDGVVRAVQGPDPLDLNAITARAADPGAHPVQAAGQIGDLGLAGRVVNDGPALGQRRRHHQVFRAGHGDDVQRDMRPLEPFGAGPDVAALD